MRTRIRMWGNSLGLRIPKAFARHAGFEAGSEVELSVQDGELVVRSLRPRRYSLDSLLRAVTEENLHREIDTGEAVGREIW